MAKTQEKKRERKEKKRGKGPVADLRGKEDKELLFEEEKLRKELFDLRLKAAGEGIPSPARISQIRREVARIETVLRERQLRLRGQEPK